MDPEAASLVARCEHLLDINDANTAWDLQGYFGDVWNRMQPDSPERVAMADVWKRMMLKWH